MFPPQTVSLASRSRKSSTAVKRLVLPTLPKCVKKFLRVCPLFCDFHFFDFLALAHGIYNFGSDDLYIDNIYSTCLSCAQVLSSLS